MPSFAWMVPLLALPNADVAGGTDRIVIAVFPLQDSAEILEPKAEKSLTDYFGVKLAESGRFIIVPRADLEAALDQQKAASYEACYDQRCQIEIGKELAAQKVLHTQIVKVGDSCAVASTLFDLRMGAAESAASQRGGCTENDLVVSIEKVAATLSQSGPRTTAAASPPPPPKPPPPEKKKATFALRVTTEPPSADVLIDGRRAGTGVGVSVPLEPNKRYELSVESEGYLPHKETITLTRDERRNVALSMTADRRAERNEWFGLSLGSGLLASSAWTAGVWLRVAHLTLGGFRWALLETYLGVVGGKTTRADEYELLDDCAQDEVRLNGYCRTGETAIAVFLGSRLGWSIALDDEGTGRLDVGVAPGLYAVTDSDDAITSIALAPSIQYVSFTDGAFAWGFGLRMIVPLTSETCRPGMSDDNGISSFEVYTRCQNSHPLMFQLEVPLGWYL